MSLRGSGRSGRRGRFNSRVASFTDWAITITALAGGGMMTMVLLYADYYPTTKMIVATAFLYIFGLVWLIRGIVKIVRARRDTVSRRAERRHPGYVDVPLQKIQPPAHRSKRSPRL